MWRRREFGWQTFGTRQQHRWQHPGLAGKVVTCEERIWRSASPPRMRWQLCARMLSRREAELPSCVVVKPDGPLASLYAVYAATRGLALRGASTRGAGH
jgi:hypothetical protein